MHGDVYLFETVERARPNKKRPSQLTAKGSHRDKVVRENTMGITHLTSTVPSSTSEAFVSSSDSDVSSVSCMDTDSSSASRLALFLADVPPTRITCGVHAKL